MDDSVNWTAIIAIIGAAAWMPQIIKWIYAAFTKAQITFIFDSVSQIGFSTSGPIFNITIAITNEHKAIVIHNMQIEIVHNDSGEKHTFGWQGIVNTLGTLSAGEQKVPFEKDQNAIAIKIGAGELEERFIRFQSIAFLEEIKPLFSRGADRLNIMRKKGTDNYDEFLSSDEIIKLKEVMEHSFCWKPGHYKCSIISESTKPFKVKDNKFSFTLQVVDIEKLKFNTDLIHQDIENKVRASQPDFKQIPVPWQWVNPKIILNHKSIKGES